MNALPASRAAIVREARSWIDTPYQHQASAKGAGCDCLGLVRGVWRAFYGDEPEAPPPYTPDWAERSGNETLRDAAQRWLVPIALEDARAGDVLLFRIASDAPAKHAGILAAPHRLVHAYWGRAVAETGLTAWWARRRAYAFSLPGVSD